MDTPTTSTPPRGQTDLLPLSRPLRYVLVGTGGMGGHWCKVTLPYLAERGLAAPAAAVDVNPEALPNAQRFLGLSADRCYTDLDVALRENDADFVVVVTPSPFHERVVDAALARGMHVLCEKPMAHTLAAASRIARKAAAAGVKMAVTMSHRFDQDKITLERAVKSGEYGRPHYITSRFTTNSRHRGDIGEAYYDRDDLLLIEAAVHHFDILRAVSGSDARTVYAAAWNPPWSEFRGDATALVTVEMQNGVRCHYEGAMTNAASLNTWGGEYVRAECEHATLELDRRRLRVLQGKGGDKPAEREIPLLEQAAWTNPWIAEMFCQWLLGEREDHPSNAQDNLQCCALTFAAVESARTGRPVDVQAFIQEQSAVAE